MSQLVIRSISGAFYAGLIITGILIDENGPLFLALFFAALGINEWAAITKEKPSKFGNLLMVSCILSGLLLFSGVITDYSIVLALWAISLLSLIGFLLISSLSTNAQGFPLISHMVLGLVYIGFPLYFLSKIGIYKAEFHSILPLSIFVMLWCSDSFAYLGGSIFGKRKLLEHISPKKTWEGFMGGLIFTLIAAYLFSTQFILLDLFEWLGLAFIVVIFGTLGDLFESATKRHFEKKDSGNLIPGHGGILDRIDSLLFSFPIAYLYLKILETI